MKYIIILLFMFAVIPLTIPAFALDCGSSNLSTADQEFCDEIERQSRCDFGITSGGECAEPILLCPSGMVLTQFGCVDRNEVDPAIIEEVLMEIELANTDVPVQTVISFVEIPETFQGSNSNSNSMSSLSWLEWTLNYQDGTETGTTEFVTTRFSPFTLSFTDAQGLRGLLTAEVRGIQSFQGIGTNFCHTLPSQTYNQELLVNGRSVSILKQLFGQNEFNPSSAINRGFGIKFTPQFIESQLASAGVDLNTGDVITWKITSNNRYTLYLGQIQADGDCRVQRGTAWDGYSTGMGFQMNFVYVDPISQIVIPSTTEPDLDGDGIPDSIDQCDFSGERFNGFQDEDGCPDDDPIGFDTSLIVDQDGDGILDVDDACPTQSENFNGRDDGDGCPDGASLDVNFMAHDATGQQTVDLTIDPIPPPLPPIFVPDETVETIIVDSGDEGVMQIIEEPETNFGVPEIISDDPMLQTGVSDTCDRSVQNCDAVIESQVNDGTIPAVALPFQLNLFSLIAIFAGIVVAILIIMFVRKRR